MSIKKARKTLQNKEKFNYDILDKVANSGGVEILTCGTCLDYYGIKDKLAVGTVSNMYTIVEKLNNADKIIKQ